VLDGSEVTVGIDIGTSSVKAVAVDADGHVLARARVPHEVHSATDGEFAHDVDVAWRQGALAALAEVAGSPAVVDRTIAGVEVSAMVPSLGAVDEDGHSVGPGLIYGDHRGHDPDYEPAYSGDSGEVATFLGWHAREAPEASGYWSAQAVANHALCGEGAIGVGAAMTGLLVFVIESCLE
jgi:xylulokinase